jgi:hypothetical protein
MFQEQQRHQCEVREWIRRRVRMGPDAGKGWLAKVLADIEKRRGTRAAEGLRSDIREQWKRGNRGEPGDWRVDA